MYNTAFCMDLFILKKKLMHLNLNYVYVSIKSANKEAKIMIQFWLKKIKLTLQNYTFKTFLHTNENQQRGQILLSVL